VAVAFFGALSGRRSADAAAIQAPQSTWWPLSKRGRVAPAGWSAGFVAAFAQGLRLDLDGVTSEGSRVAIQARRARKDCRWS